MTEHADFDFVAGEVLFINKPVGWTSFDVVNKIRYALKQYLGIKKIKIGHAGTLDPLASGLLIICTGRKTKIIDQFQQLDKTYSGVIRLGATTPSFDLETEIDKSYPFDHISASDLMQAMSTLTGKLQQIPPLYSAIKIKGKRAYLYARNEDDVELAPREIIIYALDLLSYEPPDVHIRVVCSKGTYIRSLARDLGIALQTGAHLAALCREQIGPYQLKDAYGLPEMIEKIQVLPRS
ncbi:MAG: tRNA pseudouridine(55) synthase TruB [Bacteroidales bacterium]|nr:tRNA pseudouridine(55) synthase TruB [Bacteroidales bacterium]MDZ4204375.1 tRNA pseudouridine(55) synthase TruB [Bacteroidales bacterium]